MWMKKAENGEAILQHKMTQIHEAVVFFNKEEELKTAKN